MLRLLALALLFSLACFSQMSTGTLTGIVTDPSQARLANVSLKLTSEDTGVPSPPPPTGRRIHVSAAAFRPLPTGSRNRRLPAQLALRHRHGTGPHCAPGYHPATGPGYGIGRSFRPPSAARIRNRHRRPVHREQDHRSTCRSMAAGSATCSGLMGNGVYIQRRRHPSARLGRRRPRRPAAVAPRRRQLLQHRARSFPGAFQSAGGSGSGDPRQQSAYSAEYRQLLRRRHHHDHQLRHQ